MITSETGIKALLDWAKERMDELVVPKPQTTAEYNSTHYRSCLEKFLRAEMDYKLVKAKYDAIMEYKLESFKNFYQDLKSA